MNMISLIASLALATLVSGSDQFWVTTVITDLKIRNQCSEFWDNSQACPAPLIRITTDINQPTKYASRVWSIKGVLSSNERPSFTSQWHGSLDSVRVAADIEGSNPLNPFGLVPKCDQGSQPKVNFNQSSTDVMERLSTRIVTITAQCFTAKILIKIDNECPYCPKPTTTESPTTTAQSSLIFSSETMLAVFIVVTLFTILFVLVFLIILRQFLKNRNGFKTCPSLESGISSITPSSSGSVDKKSSEFVDFFSFMPPEIDYEEFSFNDTSLEMKEMPKLGSLVYEIFPKEKTNLNLSVSEAVYV